MGGIPVPTVFGVCQIFFNDLVVPVGGAGEPEARKRSEPKRSEPFVGVQLTPGPKKTDPTVSVPTVLGASILNEKLSFWPGGTFGRKPSFGRNWPGMVRLGSTGRKSKSPGRPGASGRVLGANIF